MQEQRCWLPGAGSMDYDDELIVHEDDPYSEAGAQGGLFGSNSAAPGASLAALFRASSLGVGGGDLSYKPPPKPFGTNSTAPGASLADQFDASSLGAGDHVPNLFGTDSNLGSDVSDSSPDFFDSSDDDDVAEAIRRSLAESAAAVPRSVAEHSPDPDPEPEHEPEPEPRNDSSGGGAARLDRMSVKELKQYIASAGLDCSDCIEKADLVARAREAGGGAGGSRTRSRNGSSVHMDAETTAWPAELECFVGLPPIADCLAGLGITSLDSFAECFDLEEGHEALVQATLMALPTKPKQARVKRNRARKAFEELVQWLKVFEEFDADGDSLLSRVECMRIPLERIRAKAGGTIADRFDALDTDRDGNITFSELFVAAELAEQAEVGVPPSPPTRSLEPEPETHEATIQLWVKTPDGATLKVVAVDGLATTVAQIRSAVAEAAQLDVSRCRLIFAGRELEDRMSLAEYNCENVSELHLFLRVEEEEDTSVDREAEQQTARVRAELAGKRLADFIVKKKIGGKDIAAVGGSGATQSISQNGVCSYVYLAVLRSARGSGEHVMQLAIKVMLNYKEGMGNSVEIRQGFDAETALLSDPERLPAHRHVMVVLHSFMDIAAGLPSWKFDSDIVNPRTMFVVMPYDPDDLKRVFRQARREGSQLFGALRAVRIVSHLLQAIRHLKSHGIVHRDIKLDNVLIASPGTAMEAAVLTDFGMCLDLTKNRIVDFRVPMPYDGIRRGGAPIALAPEVTLPKPGPDVFLDYSKNDEWAVGLVAHELLSQEGCSPFPDMEHPATYSDMGYQQETIPQVCRSLVCGLLRIAVSDRLDAIEGCRRAQRLEKAVSEDAEILAAEAAARDRIAAEEEAASLALARRLQEEEEAAARAHAPERQAPEAEPEPQQAQRSDAVVKLTNETIREAVRAFCEEGGGTARATMDSPNATAKYGPVSSWDVSGVTNMSNLFKGMKAFNQPIGEWRVDQVTNMRSMFEGAAAFNQPIGEWRVDQVTDMRSMFDGAAAFNQSVDWRVG